MSGKTVGLTILGVLLYIGAWAIAIMVTMKNYHAASEITSRQVSVDPTERILRDATGRHLILHGVNVVYKETPYLPVTDAKETDADTTLTEDDIKQLQKWGMNFVRLGVMWEAVEKKEGEYDEDYLNKTKNLIDKLGKYGIYTLLDSHQDVMARITCGEGIPDFYAKQVSKDAKCTDVDYSEEPFKTVETLFQQCKKMDDFGYEQDENGWPKVEECLKVPFFKYYTSAEAQAISDALYTNKQGLQDKFVKYWGKVAEVLGNNTYVIGFDPINEPFPANFMTNPEMLTEKGKFDRDQLAPLYAKVLEEFQKHHENTTMFFETGQYPDSHGVDGETGIVNPAGFETPPGGVINSKNHVFNDHSYCCQLGGDICASGEPDAKKGKECKKWHDERISQRNDDALKLGLGLMISEFGACYDSEACKREITQVAEASDKYLASWAYWQFKYFKDITTTGPKDKGSEGLYNSDKSPQTHKLEALTRTYMQKTQGTLKKMSFDFETKDFQAQYIVNTKIGAPSELYINTEFQYKDGWDLSILDNSGKQIGDDKEKVKVINAGGYTILIKVVDETLNGEELTVKVSKKAKTNKTILVTKGELEESIKDLEVLEF